MTPYFVVREGLEFLLCKRDPYEQPGRTSQVIGRFSSEQEAWDVCQKLNPTNASWSFGGVVVDAGGGQVKVAVARETERYPEDGEWVLVSCRLTEDG